MSDDAYVIDPAESPFPGPEIPQPQRRARPRREIAALEVDPLVIHLRESFAPLDVRLSPADFHPHPPARRMLDTWDDGQVLWLGVPRGAQRAEVLYALAALRLLADGWPDPRDGGALAGAVLGAGARSLLAGRVDLSPTVSPLVRRLLIQLDTRGCDVDDVARRAWALLIAAPEHREDAVREIRRRHRLCARRVVHLLDHFDAPATAETAQETVRALADLPSCA